MDHAARNALGAGGLRDTPPECNRTFALLKPDAVRRGLVGAILAILETPWFNLRRLELVMPRRDQVEAHYARHADKPYFAALVDFMRSGPVVACVLHSRLAGVDAVAQLRAAMGPFDARVAGTIRGDLMHPGDTMANLIHGADTPAEAAREASLWLAFPAGVDFHNC